MPLDCLDRLPPVHKIRCACYILLFALGADGRAEEYELGGSITVKRVINGRPNETRADFTVYVKGHAWVIRLQQKNLFSRKGETSEVGSPDGRELFEVTSSEAADGHTFSRAVVLANPVPVGNTEVSSVGHLWLMFASGYYLGLLQGDRLIPVYDYMASIGGNPNLTRRAEWTLLNGRGSLPSSVVYFSRNGSMAAQYKVTQTTNVGNVVLPSSFDFELFGASPRSAHSGLRPASWTGASQPAGEGEPFSTTPTIGLRPRKRGFWCH
jgi:hypothetical protein